jgi:hypothetical protein
MMRSRRRFPEMPCKSDQLYPYIDCMMRSTSASASNCGDRTATTGSPPPLHLPNLLNRRRGEQRPCHRILVNSFQRVRAAGVVRIEFLSETGASVLRAMRVQVDRRCARPTTDDLHGTPLPILQAMPSRLRMLRFAQSSASGRTLRIFRTAAPVCFTAQTGRSRLAHTSRVKIYASTYRRFSESIQDI